MRILLVGKGGREHALAFKLSRSPHLTEMLLWPGSPVMESFGERVDWGSTDLSASFPVAAQRAKERRVDLVVSGPETPLSLGLADAFAKVEIPVFGPCARGAELESSKSFAKALMKKAKIPTAAYDVAADENRCLQLAQKLLREEGGAVLKASGLAAGKGVFVCFEQAEIQSALLHLYHSDMKTAAREVVVESVLVGRECSFFCFLGGAAPIPIGFAVDHKRLLDGDKGPNTGGMGCYAPVPWLPADAEKRVMESVVLPLDRALKQDGIHYRGCLYVGLMWSAQKGPEVVEFNVRFGDPEAQVLTATDDRDWLQAMAASAGVKGYEAFTKIEPLTAPHPSVAVVMCSKSYPFGNEPPEAAPLPRDLFANRHSTADRSVFGAALKQSDSGEILSGSGRVLTVVGRGEDFRSARQRAYEKVSMIRQQWPSACFRTDIALSVTNP